MELILLHLKEKVTIHSSIRKGIDISPPETKVQTHKWRGCNIMAGERGNFHLQEPMTGQGNIRAVFAIYATQCAHARYLGI
jgi:hypothetical protein